MSTLLDQLIADVQSGTRSLNDLRSALGRPLVTGDESVWLSSPDLLRQRITAIYTNARQADALNAQSSVGAPAPTPVDNSNAQAYIQTVLDSYGLGSLAGWAYQQIQEGRSSDYVLMELRNRPEFQARFPAIAARQAAGLPPLSPAEYVAYEQQASQLMRQFGMPPGFGDQPSDFTDLLTNDVSIAELYERVQQGYQEVAYAAPEVVQAFETYTGLPVGTGTQGLAAYFIDPDRAMPALRNLVTEAQIGGAALQHGLSADQEMARSLREFGVTESEAQAGFGQVRSLDPLFAETVSEGTDLRSNVEGVGAVFGTDAAAARLVQQRQASRLAAFQGGGGAAAGQRGLSGAGADDPTI